MGTTIRKAEKADVPQILAFIRGLADYERLMHLAQASEADLERDGFGPRPFFECLIAEHDGQPAGFALYFFNYSTFAGRPGIYLEDLFVYPALRGRGIGKALLCRIAAVAVENGCARFEWSVLDWNQPAIDFYSSVGGQFMDEWRLVRLAGNALEQLAASDGARERAL
jgi:GNAT superfamily N-acetyltransferase